MLQWKQNDANYLYSKIITTYNNQEIGYLGKPD